MKTALKFIAGSVFIIFALSSVGQGSFFSFLLFVAGAFITMPPFYKFLKKAIGFDLSSPVKYVASAMFFLLGVGLFNNSNKKKAQSNPLSAVETKIVRDTIFIHDTVYIESEKTKIKTEQTTKNVSSLSEVQSNTLVSEPVVEKKKTRKSTKSSYSSGSGYTRGPRGGCYYISSSGRKVYVDRSLCD